MTAKETLEKVQAMRKELEEESRLLIEEQQTLEKHVLALEEQVTAQELKKENALVEDLRSKNKAIKSSIAQLEARKKELETKLGQTAQTPECTPEAQKASASSAHPEEAEASGQTEADAEENGVTITIVESEESEDAQEEKPKKKKRRLF